MLEVEPRSPALERLARHPQLRERIAEERARRRLIDFMELFWPVLEPGRRFVRGKCIEVICEHLEAVHRGEIKRLLINVPPGTSKSLTLDVFFPAWEWGPRQEPWKRYISWSYTEKITLRDNRKARSLMQSRRYRELYGRGWYIDPDQNTKGLFANSRTGFKMASSIRGVGTGERADRLFFDDPHSVMQAESEAIRETTLSFFSEALPSRINDDDSAIVVIMQRTHASDVAGLILSSELDYEWLCLPMEYETDHPCYTSLRRPDRAPERVRRIHIENETVPRWIPADAEIPEGCDRVGDVVEKTRQDWRTQEGELLWPQRFSADYLENDLKPSLRAFGGVYAESGQLQQRPTPRGGGTIQKSDFQYIDLDELPEGIRWVRGYDLAGTKRKKSPYTASVKMGRLRGAIYIADGDRYRKTPGLVEQTVIATAKADGYGVEISIPQDPGQAGLAQKAHYAQLLTGFRVHFSPETGDKYTRLLGFAAECENRNVYLVRGPWNTPYVNELIQARPGGVGDWGDATSRAHARLTQSRPVSRAAPGRVIG